MRLVQKEGCWQFDLRRKALGRGIWLCFDSQCHELKSLRRFFKQDAERISSDLAMIKQVVGNRLPVTDVKMTSRVAA
jgi:predicted RNA-binding protein YlxR (DUF448 family)